MCEYIDRTGRFSPKDTNKRKKSGEQYKIEKLNVRRDMKLMPAVIRIYVQSHIHIPNLTFVRPNNHLLT